MVARFDRVWHTGWYMFNKDNSCVRQTWGSIKAAVVGSAAATVFGVAILCMSLLAGADPVRVFTQSNSLDQPIRKVEMVDYYLPYPGILPDNPLYKLKAARDIVSLWLIPDGEKKAEKELRYADKRIGAAVALVDGGKKDLGVTTATKAEKYLESSVNRTVKISRDGSDVKSLMLTQIKATAKHAEVLRELNDKAGGLDQSLARTERLREEVDQAFLESK